MRSTEDDDDENDVEEEEDHQEQDGVLRTSTSSTTTLSNIPSLTVAFSSAATTGGTSYAFGLYAAALKRQLHLTQGELDSISTAFFVAGLFSWLPGLCSDKFGTRFALTTGGVTGATTLLLYWAVARQFIPLQHGWLVLVLSSLGVGTFLSCAMVTGAVFKIIVATAGPGLKGSAVGAAKGYVGLGAGLYACIFEAIRGPETSDLDFLPMAATLFLCCATLPGLILLPSKSAMERCTVQDEATPKHVRILYLSLAAMAVLIVANSMLNLYETAHHTSQAASGSTNVVSSMTANDGADNQEEPVILAEHDLMTQGTTKRSNWLLGLFLLSIWVGPIASLLFLPREKRSHSDGVILIPDHDDDEEEEVEESNQRDRDQCDNLDLEPEHSMRRRQSGSNRASDHEDPLATTTSSSNNKEDDDDDGEEERGLLAQSGSGAKNERTDAEAAAISERVAPDEDEINLNLFEMLQTKSAMFMLWTTTILVGAGTVMTNNAGQMVEALGFPPAVTSASLALFSVAQAVGRVLTGSVSEAALNWNTHSFGIDNGIPRPFFLVVASLVGFLSHFLLGLAHSEFVFVVGATLAGLAFGCVWPLMVLITGEVFGTANVGANYMFYDGFTSAAGTLLLTKVVAQDVYERHIGPNSPDEYTCVGTGCFRNTHMAVAALSLTCVVTSFGMLYSTRHIYNKVALHSA